MSHLKPEERARVWIDRKLNEAGWNVINRDEFAPGMTAAAVREAPMKGGLEADYLFLINGKAAAVLEAKREEVKLDDPHLIVQAENYTQQALPWYPVWASPIPFVYLANGNAIAFKDVRTPDARYEIIPDFPRPKDLVRRLGLKGEFDGLPHLFKKSLRDCQYDAIRKLEASFKAGKRRALMVLATGSGKTFTACMIAYRMLAYTPMKRVLFLVDRNNLGVAAKTALQTFTLTESGKSFADIYGVEQLSSRPIESRTAVVISTIQRLYSKLTGSDAELTEEAEDDTFKVDSGKTVELPENPQLPPDFFDLIIIDECHRSIYSDWQKVLTYFKTARLIGMTATPIPETLAFFDNNQVADYTLEQSVVDGVNVGYRIFRIETELGENGGEIEAGDTLKAISRGSGTPHDQTALADRSFEKTQLNRSLFVRDQIRKVLQTYKDAVYTQMYPNREPNFDWLPKTLIFAASDIHAKLIVEVAKEVFGRTDDKFVQRITYSVGNSNALIREFRYNREFRIAVTVTLVATGTDVKPLEVLIFLNDVHSETLYTQMRGRGVRTISDSSLREVTPNADHKDLFYLVDAVGVTASEKFVPGTDAKEKRPLNPSLEHLLEQMALGVVPDDYLQLLAGKLSSIGNRADPEEISEYNALSDVPILDWAERIFDALNHNQLPPYESAEGDNTERLNLIEGLLSNLPARKKLIEIAKGYVKEIVGKTDTVIKAGFSHEEAQKSTHAFETYVRTHRDDIETLRLIYNQESGKLTSALIADLYRKLAEAIPGFNVMRLWSDYRLLDADHVTTLKPGDETQAATNLIQLVRFAYGLITSLYSLTSEAARRFELWCGQRQRELELSPAQKELFRKIAFYVSQNGGCDFRHLRTVMPEIANGLIKWLRSAASANEHIYSLSDFILKAA